MLKESIMYIIKKLSVCRYSDKELINIVCFTSDSDKAHNYVNKMNAFTKTVKCATGLRIKHSIEYIEANPNGAVGVHAYFYQNDPQSTYQELYFYGKLKEWLPKYKEHMKLYDLTIDATVVQALKDYDEQECLEWHVEEVPELA
jgi:hypothetical protein